MRILIVSSHAAVVGGVERYLQALLPTLTQQGHSVGFAFEYPPSAASEPVDAAGTFEGHWCLTELGIEELLSRVAAWKPDVVYAHGLQSTSLESKLLDRFPVALFAHDYYGTCATGRKCHLFPKPQTCHRRFGPMCLALHYPARCGGLSPVTALRNYYFQARRAQLLPRYHAVLVASRHMCSEFLNHGVESRRLFVVPLPPTRDVPEVREPEPRLPTGRLLFLGRLTDLKGAHYLIKAVNQAERELGRPLTLTIGGTGPEQTRLQALASRLGVKADFVGWLNPERRTEMMRQAELLVLPSLWPEPFGLVGIEAGCLGLPAVGFAVGGIPEWLIPGQSGELAPGDPPTVAGLTEAIVRALQATEHYRHLCRGAWEVAKKFTMQEHLAKLEYLFHTARLRGNGCRKDAGPGEARCSASA